MTDFWSLCSNISLTMKTGWFPALPHSWFHTAQTALLKPYSERHANSLFSFFCVHDRFRDDDRESVGRMADPELLIFCNLPSSPQVAGLSTRFRFGPPEDVLSQASASHSDLGQLASQGGTIYTCAHTRTAICTLIDSGDSACNHLHRPSQLISQLLPV